jgi:hypothetical protein
MALMSVARARRMASPLSRGNRTNPAIDQVAIHRCLAEGSQWGPVLLEPRAGLTPHNRAYIAAP